MKMDFSTWTKGKIFYIIMWLLTSIFLITTIILFVVWQQSSIEWIPTTGDKKVLTNDAIYKQNVIASITFITIVFLTIAIFATTIESYLKKKRQIGKK